MQFVLFLLALLGSTPEQPKSTVCLVSVDVQMERLLEDLKSKGSLPDRDTPCQKTAPGTSAALTPDRQRPLLPQLLPQRHVQGFDPTATAIGQMKTPRQTRGSPL